MLETHLTQGSGLYALAPMSAVRVVAMVSQGDRQQELPLLCGLCAAWNALGYPVAVLDATVIETASAPGLLQIWGSPHCSGTTAKGELAWSIFPSALGVEQLCQKHSEFEKSETALQQLEQLFHNYSIVLLYASANTLAACLPDSGVRPLLTVSNQGNSILRTYQSLKQLLIFGRLDPTIVALSDETKPQDNQAAKDTQGAQGTYANLQDCAIDFLGHEVTPLHIAANTNVDSPSADMNRLALRLLEGAASASSHQHGHHTASVASSLDKQPSARPITQSIARPIAL